MIKKKRKNEIGDILEFKYYYPENGNNFDVERYNRSQKEKSELKYLSKVFGCCLIGYVVLQNLVSFIFLSKPLYELYQNDATFQSIATIFFSVISLMIPFGIASLLITKKFGCDTHALNRPVSVPLMITAVPFGIFVCLAGNYISSILLNLMESGGIKPFAPDFNVPDDVFGRFIYIISIAVVPPLVEEYAMRGVVLQPLRRYGDTFAIVVSAFVFAILHGNLVQSPFALIAGIGIGYAVCITNSVWTGVLIHFANNLYSVIIEFLIADIPDEKKLNLVYNLINVPILILSVLGSILFVLVKGKRRVLPSFTASNTKEKTKAVVLTVPMIISLLIMLMITAQYIAR